MARAPFISSVMEAAVLRALAAFFVLRGRMTLSSLAAAFVVLTANKEEGTQDTVDCPGSF
jgi:hypothetical protein